MNNRGDTLIEIIVTVVLLGTVLVACMNAFSTARETNNISNKYIKAENLATSIIEESHNADFDYLSTSVNENNLDPNSAECIFKIPSNMSTDSSWVITESSNDKIVMTLSNIKSSKVSYNVQLELDRSSYEDEYNNVQFVVLDTISEDKTCIIDSVGANNGNYTKDENGSYQFAYTTESLKYFISNLSDFSYDNLALEKFLSLNKTYIDKKLTTERKKIEEENKKLPLEEQLKPEELELIIPKIGDIGYTYIEKNDIKQYIDKTLDISVIKYNSNGEEIIEINATAKYKLEQVDETGNWVEIIESEENKDNINLNREYSSMIVKGAKYPIRENHYSNIYLMYVPLGEGWKKDSVEINNGTNLDNCAEFNFYFVVQPFDSDSNEITDYEIKNGKPYYNNINTNININTFNPNKKIEVYTNTLLNNASLGVSVSNLYEDKLHLLSEKYTRLFDVTVTVKDNNKNILYTAKDTNVIK